MLICSTQFSTKTILTHPPHYHSKPIVDLLPSTAQQIVSQNISWKSVKTPEYKVGPKTWYQCVVSNPSSLCIIAFWALVPDWPREVSLNSYSCSSKAVSWGIWFVSLFCTLRKSKNTRTFENSTLFMRESHAKSVLFWHVRVFFDQHKVQKRATKFHTSGHCLLHPPSISRHWIHQCEILSAWACGGSLRKDILLWKFRRMKQGDLVCISTIVLWQQQWQRHW